MINLIESNKLPAAIISLYFAILRDNENVNRDHILKLFNRLDHDFVSYKTQNEVIERAEKKRGLSDLVVEYRNYNAA